MFDAKALVAVFDRVLLDPRSLEAAFTELPRVTNASVAFAFNLAPGRPGLLGDSIAAEMQRVYAIENWQGADIFTGRTRSLPMNEIHLSDDFLPAQTIREHPFFTNYLHRWDIHRGAGWWFDLEGEPWVFALGRGAGQGPFTPREIAALREASTRINWSLAAVNRLATSRTEAIRDTFDMVAAPYVIIDHRGWAVRTTPAAERMFDDRFGLQGAVLRASDPRANDHLQQVAAMARCGALGSEVAGIRPPDTIVIPRDGVRQPVIARPLRLRRPLYDALPGAQIVLRLDDLDHSRLPSASLLEAIFSLTPREIEVARSLAAGHPSPAICSELNLTRGYLQAILSAIYTKTHTHSRQELVALLARFPDQA